MLKIIYRIMILDSAIKINVWMKRPIVVGQFPREVGILTNESTSLEIWNALGEATRKKSTPASKDILHFLALSVIILWNAIK
jgi:hypothetical protein